jgi:hypothetical protein
MHLLTFMELRKPGPLFRAAVIGAQGARTCCVIVNACCVART